MEGVNSCLPPLQLQPPLSLLQAPSYHLHYNHHHIHHHHIQHHHQHHNCSDDDDDDDGGCGDYRGGGCGCCDGGGVVSVWWSGDGINNEPGADTSSGFDGDGDKSNDGARPNCCG